VPSGNDVVVIDGAGAAVIPQRLIAAGSSRASRRHSLVACERRPFIALSPPMPRRLPE
jgi:hypothetical protein